MAERLPTVKHVHTVLQARWLACHSSSSVVPLCRPGQVRHSTRAARSRFLVNM